MIHDFRYDYSLVDYKNCMEKVKIVCKKHGIFEQTPNKHLVGHGCSKCNQSKGEMKIEIILKNENINFIKQKTFPECKNIKLLPFDFYLPELNICIEYDGDQHYKIIQRFGGESGFLYRQNNDKIKTEYCKNNNIFLIRLKNKEYDDLLEIIKKYNK